MNPEELAALTRRPEPGPHHATVTIDDVDTRTLADLPPARDGLLFVGLNPSPVSVAAGNTGGIRVSGVAGEITGNTASGNAAEGFLFALAGNSRVQRNLAFGNATGFSLSTGGTLLFGDTDLAAGNGNVARDNSGTGVSASSGVTVAGNRVSGNGGTGINSSSARVVNNVVSGGAIGVYAGSATVELKVTATLVTRDRCAAPSLT